MIHNDIKKKLESTSMEYLHNIMEILGLIVAIIYYPYIRNSFMKWFLPFLAFIAIGELIGSYFIYVMFVKPGHAVDYRSTNEFIIVNADNYLLGIIQPIFCGYIFYQLTQSKLLRKIICILVPISVLISLYRFFFSKNVLTFIAYAWVTYGTFTAIIALGYIYTKIIEDDVSFGVTEPGFWIALGVSLFFSGTSIAYLLYDFILKNNLNFLGMRLYNFVPRMLCVVLYSCLSIAIILYKKKTKIAHNKAIAI